MCMDHFRLIFLYELFSNFIACMGTRLLTPELAAPLLPPGNPGPTRTSNMKTVLCTWDESQGIMTADT